MDTLAAPREARGVSHTLLEQKIDDNITYNSRSIDGDEHSYYGDTIDTSRFDSLNNDSFSNRPRERSRGRGHSVSHSKEIKRLMKVFYTMARL